MHFHNCFRQKLIPTDDRICKWSILISLAAVVNRSSKCSSGFMWNRTTGNVFVSILLYIIERIKIHTGINEDVSKEVCRLLFQSAFLLGATIFKHLNPERSLMVLWDRWAGALPPHNYQRSSAHLSNFNQRPEPFEGLWRNLMQNRGLNASQICPRHTQFASGEKKGGREIQYRDDVHNNWIIVFFFA